MPPMCACTPLDASFSCHACQPTCLRPGECLRGLGIQSSCSFLCLQSPRLASEVGVVGHRWRRWEGGRPAVGPSPAYMPQADGRPPLGYSCGASCQPSTAVLSGHALVSRCCACPLTHTHVTSCFLEQPVLKDKRRGSLRPMLQCSYFRLARRMAGSQKSNSAAEANLSARHRTCKFRDGGRTTR